MKNNIKKIINEEIKKLITEIISPIVWHFCWLDNLKSILEMNAFKLTLSEINNDEKPGITGYSSRHKYYMCTTRSKISYEGYSSIVSDNNKEGFARITLNGDLLNNIIHGKASDYFGTRSNNYHDLDGKRRMYKEIEKYGRIRYKSNIEYNEKEDTIWSNKPIIPNANKYIERIDVFIPKENIKNIDLFKYIKNISSNLNIPIFFYSEIKEFDLQRNNINI